MSRKSPVFRSIRTRWLAMSLLTASAAVGLFPGSVVAQPPPTCPVIDGNLPPAMASWARKVDIGSALSVSDLAKARLTPGQAARVRLQDAGAVSYPAPPQKPLAPGGQGGLVAFSVDQAGTYRVGLSSGTWIDVVKDDQVQVSAAHSHGPDCSSLHKMVDFVLRPGTYLLQISGAADPEIGVMVLKLP